MAYELLDEIFTRQTKCVLDGNNDLINPKCCLLNERVLLYWKTNISSNRLFFRQCWKKNDHYHQNNHLHDLYNNNFGLPIADNDDNFALKFKKLVENIYYNVSNFN